VSDSVTQECFFAGVSRDQSTKYYVELKITVHVQNSEMLNGKGTFGK